MSNIHKRGFASFSLEKRKEVAAKGGRTAQQLGKAHAFSHEEAVLGGKKGKKKRKEIIL